MLKKSTLAVAVGLCLDTGIASAAKFNMTFMDFPGAQNTTVVGTIDTALGTGTITSGVTPFFGHNWTGTVVVGFESTGPGTWNYSAASGASATGSYNFTLAPGQVAMGILFDWNTSFGIPVLNILNADGSGVDIDGDGTLGTVMAEGPFKGSPVGFAGNVIEFVTANDVALTALAGQSTPWFPSLSGSGSVTCAISQQPAAGTATVLPDCSSGTFTGNVNDTFVYTATSAGGTDPGTVTVTVSVATPPSAQPDTASTTVGAAVAVDVLGNDTDADGTLDPATVVVTAQPSNGTISGVNTSTGEVTYQPDPGFCGVDSFSYTVDDNDAQTSNAASVTVNVNPDVPCSSENVTLSGGSSDPDNDGQVTLSELISAGIDTDSAVTQQCIGGCFDYVLSGVTGPTASVILPLSEPIPNLARLRKWDGTAWTDFVLGANDSVSTTASVGGVCPPTGYTPNLKEGDDCIQLVLSDGGPNDQDGIVDGTIIDPVGVGRESVGSATTDLGSAGGCTIAKTDAGLFQRLEWIGLAGFLAWLGFRRKARS